jgi:hypothetical protein
MSSQPKVRALLDGRLDAWNKARGRPYTIVWQNTQAEPPELHLRPFLIPVEVFSLDLEGKHRGYEGIYQISIVSPVGNGPGAAEAVGEELAALFPVNLIVAGDVRVQVLTPMSPGPALQESFAWSYPVSCTVRSDTITL